MHKPVLSPKPTPAKKPVKKVAKAKGAKRAPAQEIQWPADAVRSFPRTAG
jgi:hypothetical protein